MNSIAMAYETGTGVPRDPSEAARWFRKAGTVSPLH
jgi:TPR repeat protein